MASNLAAYADFTYAKGKNLTRFLNYNVHGTGVAPTQPATRDTPRAYYPCAAYIGDPFGPQLGDVFVTTSTGRSTYRGLTLGARKRYANKYQFEANYVLSKDEDDDSNERDPFHRRVIQLLRPESRLRAVRSRHPPPLQLLHLSPSCRSASLINVRVQARSAQPITTSPRVLNGDDRGRNWDRKDNKYFSLDWRLQRSFRVGGRYDIIPSLEMFNTFNNANNVNPLSTVALLFNFDGFLRQGVGDPRQLQVAVKVAF